VRALTTRVATTMVLANKKGRAVDDQRKAYLDKLFQQFDAAIESEPNSDTLRTINSLNNSTVFEFDPDRPRGFDRCKTKCVWVDAPPGDVGATPEQRVELVRSNDGGSDGSVQIGKATWLEIAQQLTVSHTYRLLMSAERDYLNGSYRDSIERLIWLKLALDGALGDKNIGHFSVDEFQNFSSQRDKANALIAQMKLGLDYFGQHYNYVPLLSVKYYTEVINQLFTHADAIERSYLIYQDKNRSAEERILELKLTRSKMLSVAVDLRSRQSVFYRQQARLQDEIAFLLTDLAALWPQLFASERQFKNAVAAQGPGCSFNDIVTFGAMVGTLIATGGTAAAAIGVAVKVLGTTELKDDQGQPVKAGIPDLKYRVDRVVTAGKDAQSFVEAYGKVRDTLIPETPENPVPRIPSDEAKIIVAASDVERELQKFTNLPEAAAYQQVLRRFVSCSQTRNNKILEYLVAVQSWHKMDADLRQTEIDSEVLLTKTALNKNPFTGEAALFMERAWRDSRTAIVSVMHQLHRSFQYYSLQDATFEANDFSVAALRSTSVVLLRQYIAERENRGADSQTFQGLAIDLTSYLTPNDLIRFRHDGVLTVTIPPGSPAFRRRSHARVSKVWVSIQGKTAQPKIINATIFHHGSSVVLDDFGKTHDFVHVPIRIAYQTDSSGVAIFDGKIKQDNGDYEGVSPFATWTIAFEDLDQKFRSGVQSIKMHFDGTARARS
jgi:hypothetical protein